VPALPFEGEVSADFSDHRREFESVTGKPSAQNNASLLGMMVDNEMPIGCQGIRTGLRGDILPDGLRHPLFKSTRDRLDVAPEVDFAIKTRRIGQLAVGVKRTFETVAEIRKTVKRRWEFRSIDQERWKPVSGKFIRARSKPCLDVALYPDR